MKKLLLSVAVVALCATVKGQKVWNFSDAVWQSAAVSAGTTVDGLTNYSLNGKASIGGSNKAYNLDDVDYTFTHCFKYGENGSFDGSSPKTGVCSFEVPGNVKISAIGTHASSSGDARELVIAAKNGDQLAELGVITAYQVNDTNAPEGLAGKLAGNTFSYAGEAATIFVYSRNGGVNLYLIKYDLDGASALTKNEIEKTIASVSYMDLLGKPLTDGAPCGVVLKKTIYTDGTVDVQKQIHTINK